MRLKRQNLCDIIKQSCDEYYSFESQFYENQDQDDNDNWCGIKYQYLSQITECINDRKICHKFSLSNHDDYHIKFESQSTHKRKKKRKKKRKQTTRERNRNTTRQTTEQKREREREREIEKCNIHSQRHRNKNNFCKNKNKNKNNHASLSNNIRKNVRNEIKLLQKEKKEKTETTVWIHEKKSERDKKLARLEKLLSLIYGDTENNRCNNYYSNNDEINLIKRILLKYISLIDLVNVVIDYYGNQFCNWANINFNKYRHKVYNCCGNIPRTYIEVCNKIDDNLSLMNKFNTKYNISVDVSYASCYSNEEIFFDKCIDLTSNIFLQKNKIFAFVFKLCDLDGIYSISIGFVYVAIENVASVESVETVETWPKLCHGKNSMYFSINWESVTFHRQGTMYKDNDESGHYSVWHMDTSERDERYIVLKLNFMSGIMKVIINPFVRKSRCFQCPISNDLLQKCLNGSIRIGAAIRTPYRSGVHLGIVRV